jgi:hypothetical protein
MVHVGSFPLLVLVPVHLLVPLPVALLVFVPAVALVLSYPRLQDLQGRQVLPDAWALAKRPSYQRGFILT